MRAKISVRRGIILAAAALGLGGCTIATPYRAGPAVADGDEVVVALTEATLDPARREAFDAHVARIAAAIGKQPGLIGYKVRRELFGARAWTMTVWRDDASRAAFVGGEMHRTAMREGLPALVDTRFARLRVKSAQAPLDWPQALEILARDGRSY